MFEIEKGIPIPAVTRERNQPSALDGLKAMEIGDSITVDKLARVNYLRRIAKENDMVMETRREDGKFRMWRTE